MTDELVRLMPEIELIEDSDLRAKTLAVIAEAISLGGWKIEDLSLIPFTLLINPCPFSYLDHVRGVTATSIRIAIALRENYVGEQAFSVDMSTLISIALLHDVGKLLEYERNEKGEFVKSEWGKRERHPDSGANLAQKHGLPKKIVDGIRYHSHEGDGKRDTVEAIIVNHADFLNFEPVKIKYG